ncbi:MAG TPA: hypothetical protein VMZ22_13195 [Acidimicrobiales bacterium]|nr:hypothetical protein [Acidimicrobiales bacterium]
MTHVSDEFLSAVVDGEAMSPSDVAHLDACDTCLGRVEQFRSVSASVAAPVSLPASHVREAAMSIALDEAPRAASSLRRLRDRRAAAKAPVTRRMSGLSAAAALIVALGVGGWALSQLGNDTGGNQRATASSAAGLPDSGAATADNNTESRAVPAETELATPAPAYEGGAIGAFTDVAAVARRATSDLEQPFEVRSQHPFAGTSPCGETDRVKWHATLTFAGVEALARVMDFGDSQWLLQVHRQTDCVLLETQAFAPTSPR